MKNKNIIKLRLIVFSLLALGMILVFFFSESIVPHDPYLQDLNLALKPPSSEFIFGTDKYGRDLFSRVIVGGKATVFAALILVFVISVSGTLVGIVCGYFEGVIDSVLMRISDVFLAFPTLVFAIAISSILGGGMMNAVIALAAVSWPKFARLSRSLVLSIKNSAFVKASKMAGSSDIKIIFTHILPNVVGNIVITATLDIGTMMMELAGLSFLNLGAMAPTAEWGLMMNNGRSMLQTSPWVILAPGFAIFISVAVFNLLGDAIRDYIDPRDVV